MERYERYFDDKIVLITGGLGFLGSNMALRLSDLNTKKIMLVDSLVSGLGGDLGNVGGLKNKQGVEIYAGSEWDIKHIPKLKSLIKESDIIFNLAGSSKHPPFNERELEFDTEINFISQIKFLEACRQVIIEHPQKKLKIIFSGTRDQYGKVPYKDLPVPEDYLPKNLTDYQSISKNAIEAHHLVLSNLLREQDINVKINSVRLVNTYGPRQSSKSGAAIPVFIEKAIKDETIELWGGGEAFRDINYVGDVIDAFLLVASYDCNGEIFNLGCCLGKKDMENGGAGGNFLSIRQLAEKIIKISGKGQIKVIPYPSERKVIEPGHFAADISKISKLGWKPKNSLEDGLRKTIEGYKKYQ